MTALRRVTIKVTSPDQGDKKAVPVYTEIDRGAGHIRESGEDMICNGKEQTFELRPGQRLVIEGFTPEAVAYDREQGAAYTPGTQKGVEGIDQPKPNVPEKGKSNEQTSQSGAKPGETQDSRLKSSPGTATTEAMKVTPAANTGAPASTPGGKP